MAELARSRDLLVLHPLVLLWDKHRRLSTGPEEPWQAVDGN